jgi:hypothetical protein
MVRSAAKPRVSNHGWRALRLVARPSRRGLRPLLRTRSVEIRSFNLTQHHHPAGPAKAAVSRSRLAGALRYRRGAFRYPTSRRRVRSSRRICRDQPPRRPLVNNNDLQRIYKPGVRARGRPRACDGGPAWAALPTKRPPEGGGQWVLLSWRRDGARPVAVMKNARRWRTPGVIPTMDFLLPRFWDFGQRKCAKGCQESS